MVDLGILSRCFNLRVLVHSPSLREGFVFGGKPAYVTVRPVPQPKHWASFSVGRSSDTAFRYFFRLVDVAALYSAIRDCIIAQVPGSKTDPDELICSNKHL